jgi:hypothetical protein
MTLQARVRGAWRVRLVAALLRIHVYIPGSFDWAARGLRLQYRVDGKGRWRDSGGRFHIS